MKISLQEKFDVNSLTVINSGMVTQRLALLTSGHIPTTPISTLLCKLNTLQINPMNGEITASTNIIPVDVSSQIFISNMGADFCAARVHRAVSGQLLFLHRHREN
jgi:hypothetical protein